MRNNPPAATLGQLIRSRHGAGNWVWAYCPQRTCGHYRALPLVPFAIRWGPDTSSDVLRRKLTCAKCGHKGALTITPSWVDDTFGWQLFPAD